MTQSTLDYGTRMNRPEPDNTFAAGWNAACNGSISYSDSKGKSKDFIKGYTKCKAAAPEERIPFNQPGTLVK